MSISVDVDATGVVGAVVLGTPRASNASSRALWSLVDVPVDSVLAYLGKRTAVSLRGESMFKLWWTQNSCCMTLFGMACIVHV
jgi:hypothetical protein